MPLPDRQSCLAIPTRTGGWRLCSLWNACWDIDSNKTKPSWKVVAVRVLAKTQGGHGVVPLIEMSKHPDPVISHKAEMGLLKLFEIPHFDKKPPLIAQHEESLAQHVDELDQIMRRRGDPRAYYAGRALGWSGPRGIAAMKRALHDGDAALSRHVLECAHHFGHPHDGQFIPVYLAALRMDNP